MSIIRIPFPNTAPIDVTDWEKNIDITEFNSYGINSPVDYNFESDTVKQGVRIMIGGTVYLVSTDESITGTPSDYVKITPAGATASAAYVTDLTGVSWNSAYNFYTDISGNAYLFDEAKAVYDGELTEAHTKVGRFATRGLFKTDSIEELTTGAGVTIDNVKIKDTGVLVQSEFINTDTTIGVLHSGFSSVLIEDGDKCIVSGAIGPNILAFANRVGASIFLQGRSTPTGASYQLELISGSATPVINLTIASGVRIKL